MILGCLFQHRQEWPSPTVMTVLLSYWLGAGLGKPDLQTNTAVYPKVQRLETVTNSSQDVLS